MNNIKKRIGTSIRAKGDYLRPLEGYIWRNPQLGLKALAQRDGDLHKLDVWMLNCTDKQFQKALLTAAMFAWYQNTDKEEKTFYDPHMGFSKAIKDLK